MAKFTDWDIELDKLMRAAYEKGVNELNNTPTHMLDIGNPNHPIHDGIFGYETKSFLAKQF